MFETAGIGIAPRQQKDPYRTDHLGDPGELDSQPERAAKTTAEDTEDAPRKRLHEPLP
jgi:hypothetical protein